MLVVPLRGLLSPKLEHVLILANLGVSVGGLRPGGPGRAGTTSRTASRHSTEPVGGARGVEHEGRPDGAGQPSGEAAQRAHQPHGLGQARRLALEGRPGALGGEVARPEPRAPGGDDEAGEAVRTAARRASRTDSTPSATTIRSTTSNPAASRCSASAAPDRSSRVPSTTPSDTVITFASSATCRSLAQARDQASAAEAEQVHAVGVGVLRAAAPRRGRAVATARRAAARRRGRAAVGQVLVDGHALGVGQRADRVDEPAARPHQVGGRVDSARCTAPSRCGGVGVDAPAGVGTAAEHAQARAGRVDEHPVERPRRGTAGARRRPRSPAASAPPAPRWPP